VQKPKAADPIEVTELGIVNELNLLQPKKAELPIAVTELGIATEVNPEQ
jgi:hypothetical protein